MALKSGQGHQPQHGMERAYHEVMQGDSAGVKERIGSATPWPPDTAVPEEMHGKIVLKGSRDQLEEIGSTTTGHGGAWRSKFKSISKTQGTHWCHHPTRWWSGCGVHWR